MLRINKMASNSPQLDALTQKQWLLPFLEDQKSTRFIRFTASPTRSHRIKQQCRASRQATII